jgi:hypothetical protein
VGLDHDEVLAVPGIGAYCERFGIEPERRRLTGAAPTSRATAPRPTSTD